MESLIVVRFIVFCWEICSFSFIFVWYSFIVGGFVVFPLYYFDTVYCCQICNYLLGDLKLISQMMTMMMILMTITINTVSPLGMQTFS